MAKIDTDITTGSISSIGTTPAVNVGSGGKVFDSNSQVLARSLSSVSEALGKYVQIKEKEKATEQTLEGANAINGMTLGEAKELHKAGFPDIKNEWARYGAYKQYASNASDNFVFEFQKEYKQTPTVKSGTGKQLYQKKCLRLMKVNKMTFILEVL